MHALRTSTGYWYLWDIAWLNQQGVNLPVALVLQKVTDRRQDLAGFLKQLQERQTLLQAEPAGRKDFLTEMRRFLPPAVVGESLEQEAFWTYLVNVIADECGRVRREVEGMKAT